MLEQLLVKVFCYCMPKQQAPNHLHSLKLVIYYKHDYKQCLLLLQQITFFFIFSRRESESDDFVLFNSPNGNGALFTKVLFDIPILRISLIRNFGWKNTVMTSVNLHWLALHLLSHQRSTHVLPECSSSWSLRVIWSSSTPLTLCRVDTPLSPLSSLHFIWPQLCFRYTWASSSHYKEMVQMFSCASGLHEGSLSESCEKKKSGSCGKKEIIVKLYFAWGTYFKMVLHCEMKFSLG